MTALELLVLKLRSETGGLLLVTKPKHWTSFDVVKKLRYALKVKKVGHAGTLDPLAIGLLLLATNKTLKAMSELQGLDKTYIGTMVLGQTTASYDLETKPENQIDISHLTSQFIMTCGRQFIGEIDQRPPLYSAVKIYGKRAYQYARQSKQIELKNRRIKIYSFQLEIKLPEIHFEVRCSKGTYIRSLVHDFGLTLGVGAYLKSLTRLKIGCYHLKDAYTIEEILNQVH